VEAAPNGQIEQHTLQRDLVVIGASAGGVDALQELVAGFPPEFPAAVLIVLHVPSTGTSVLPQILSRRGPLPAVFARDGDELRRGQIYVAPADNHMLVHDGHVTLTRGPRENGHRPAIDPLFRSAARAADSRCIGVVMSGLLDDGALGARLIHEMGGTVVVQDPDDASFPSMPRAVLAVTEVDRVVSARAMADALCALIDLPLEYHASRAGDGDQPVIADVDEEGADRVEISDPAETAELVHGPPTELTCPECGGVLWEQDNGDTIRYACHVGHAYTMVSLVEEQGRELETTLWSAVRSLEERADVHRRLARRVQGSRRTVYEQRAVEAEQHARSLRRMLAVTGRLAAPAPDEA
jgi:two-component system, chemotaxis family, protein-glutamate methylesterase/glutaminase